MEYPDTYNHWLSYVSGALDEMFAKWGRGADEGYRDQWQWEQQVEEAQYSAAHGKAFLAFTQGSQGETQAARYGYASVCWGVTEALPMPSPQTTPANLGSRNTNTNWVRRRGR